jgi:YidC/Oxa1 family membrane protein insertase
MTFFYHTFIFYPLYNAFVLLIDGLPFLDAGVIVIVFTIIIRLILFPLAKKSVRTQALMREVNPEVEKIKEKYKDDKQKQSLETFALYKKYKLNPFASVLLLLIQIPILLALYRIFLFAGFAHIDAAILYPFVPVPTHMVSTTFLWLFDVTQKSWILALVAALSQFYQAKLVIPPAPEKKDGPQSMGDSFARNMTLQMKYVMPAVIFFIAYTATSVVAIYWTVSNIFMIGQELYVRRQIKKNPNVLIEQSAGPTK